MRTRLRRVRLDELTFTWLAEIHHVRGSTDCHRCIRVRVWADGKTSQALQADLLSLTWPAPWGACATDDAYPVPADVRKIITYALANGWQPGRRGGTFLLSEEDHAAHFWLPDFLLTDRRRTATAGDPTTRVMEAYERRRRATLRPPQRRR